MLLTTILIYLHVAIVFNVNRHKFKECHQSGFCKRAFAYTLIKDRYNFYRDSLICKDGSIVAKMDDKVFNKTLLVSIFALEHNRIRFKVVEADPLHPRYDVFKDAWRDLQPEPAVNSSVETVLNELSDTCQFKFSTGYKLVASFHPFYVTIYNENNEKTITLNAQQSLYLEPHLYSQKQPEKIVIEGSKLETNDSSESNTHADKFDTKETFDGHTDAQKRGFQGVSFDATFHDFEHVYGLPEHADSFALKIDENDPYRLFNLDVFEFELYNRMALYGSVPYLVAKNPNKSVGLLFLNPSELWVTLSKKQPSKVYSFFGYISKDEKTEVSSRWVAESGIVDVFIMMGPLPHQMTYQYALTTGFQQLPPIFSVAYHQCRWNYISQHDVQEVNANFDIHSIPYDVIWLDIEHTPNRKYFLWDTSKFPDSLGMIKILADDGRKLVTIVDPHVSKSSGYFINTEGTELDYFVKNTDNRTYDGWCWPGDSVYPDFMRPEVRQWWASKFSPSIYKGTTTDVYTWIDMNEPSVFNGPEVTIPKDVLHGDWENRDVHNLYGMMYHLAAYEGGLVRGENALRPFVLTRAFFAGSQKYGAAWTGDNTASWAHLKSTVPMLLSLSIAGIHFCGADVGGFFKNPSEELLIRWFQAGSMQPFFRGHSHIETNRREFWLFSEKTQESLRFQVLRRYRYLPYIYSMFQISHTLGTPVMRPLWFDFPADKNTLPIDDSYLFGNALLIYPVVDENKFAISLYFPTVSDLTTIWWDCLSGTRYSGGQTATVKYTSMDHLPMFQLGGTIIPTWYRIRRSSSKMMNDPITLEIALNSTGSAKGQIYFDDGTSFKYTEGVSAMCFFEFSNGKLTSRFVGQYLPKNWLERVVITGLQNSVTKAAITADDVTTQLLLHHIDTNRVIIRRPGVKFTSPFVISLQ